jgi:aryl-alcohol dehydrogenase-like predicted oxidoreductase
MKSNKIALGTAQFGMDYGINNQRGKIPENEVFEILYEALRSGIDTLDSAYAYGDSEAVIGCFIRESKKDFKIVSKSPKCEVVEMANIFDSSLRQLGINAFYGYLIHSFDHYRKYPDIWNKLEKLKSDEKIEKIGFSLYFPTELDYILENKLNIDIIQVPYSIFDQRFAQYFQELKNKDIEVHVRSVFLQGLVFKNPGELDNYFTKIKEKLENLNLLSIKQNIPIVALCLNFVAINSFVDKVVVGVDGLNNLKEIVSSLDYHRDVENIISQLSLFKEDDENIILPLNWKVNRS